jgi:hypothetical protein
MDDLLDKCERCFAPTTERLRQLRSKFMHKAVMLQCSHPASQSSDKRAPPSGVKCPSNNLNFDQIMMNTDQNFGSNSLVLN